MLGGEGNPLCLGGPSWRGQRLCAVSPRGELGDPVLHLVEGILGVRWTKAPLLSLSGLNFGRSEDLVKRQAQSSFAHSEGAVSQKAFLEGCRPGPVATVPWSSFGEGFLC